MDTVVDEIGFHSANTIVRKIVNQLCAEIPGSGLNNQITILMDEMPPPTPPSIAPLITTNAISDPKKTALLQTMVTSMDAMQTQFRPRHKQVRSTTSIATMDTTGRMGGIKGSSPFTITVIMITTGAVAGINDVVMKEAGGISWKRTWMKNTPGRGTTSQGQILLLERKRQLFQ